MVERKLKQVCRLMAFIVLFASLGLFTVQVHAEPEPDQTTSDQSQNQNQNQNSGGSINDSARKGENSQKIGQAINGVVGAGMVAYGAKLASAEPTRMQGIMMIGMGLQALAQMAAMGGAAGQSGAVGDYTQTFDDWELPETPPIDPPDSGNPGTPGGDPFGPGGPGGDGGGSGFLAPGVDPNLVNDALKTASTFGVKVNGEKQTITTPEGQEIPLSAFSSEGGMAAAGFGSGAIRKAMGVAQRIADAANDSYSVSAMEAKPLAGAGGGGGYGAGKLSLGEGGDPLADYLASLRKKKGRKPAKVAGKSIKFGDDPIGVKADNIFKMIHRKYQQKRKGNNFIESAALPKQKKK